MEPCPRCSTFVGEREAACPACGFDLSFPPGGGPRPEPRPATPRRDGASPPAGTASYRRGRAQERWWTVERHVPWSAEIVRRLRIGLWLAAGGLLLLCVVQYYSMRARRPGPFGMLARWTGHAWDPLFQPWAAQGLVEVEVLKPQAPASRPAPGRGPGPAPAPRRPDAAARAWSYRGAVYDLMTLRPVGLAQLVFQDSVRGTKFETFSRRDGRFRVDLPPPAGKGYYLVASHQGYHSRYVLGAGPGSARSWSPRRRRAAALELERTLPPPRSIGWETTAGAGSQIELFLLSRDGPDPAEE